MILSFVLGLMPRRFGSFSAGWWSPCILLTGGLLWADSHASPPCRVPPRPPCTNVTDSSRIKAKVARGLVAVGGLGADIWGIAKG